MAHRALQETDMCGIVGVAGNIDVTNQKVLEDLLIMDQLRGKHSVGIASVKHDGSPSMFKKAMDVNDFFQLDGYKKIKNVTNNVIIGHNRYATQGAINTINAHPFAHGNIMGVHNGTLRDQGLLPDSNQFVVDSENIIYSLDKLGVEQTVNKLHGAYALTWWNTETGKLQMVRNDERPLHYAFSADDKTVFWASEKYMLMAALDRRKVKHKAVQALPVHTLLTLDVPLGFSSTSKPIPKPSLRKLTPYVKPAPKVVVHPSIQARRGYVPPFLANLGYTLSDRVDVQFFEVSGNRVSGTTLDDNSFPVSCYVANSTKRDKLLGWNGYHSASICGFTQGTGDGCVNLALNTLVEKEYVPVKKK